MRKILLVLGVLAFIGLSVSANAATIVDTVGFGYYGIVYDSDGTSAYDTVISYGYNSANYISNQYDWLYWGQGFVTPSDYQLENVVSASLTLWLSDDAYGDWYDGYEYSWLWAEDTGWTFIGEIDSGLYSFELDLEALDFNFVRLLVDGAGGDFYVNGSRITIDYDPVPEPATMFLLGSGLVGLAGFRRKFKK